MELMERVIRGYGERCNAAPIPLRLAMWLGYFLLLPVMFVYLPIAIVTCLLVEPFINNNKDSNDKHMDGSKPI